MPENKRLLHVGFAYAFLYLFKSKSYFHSTQTNCSNTVAIAIANKKGNDHASKQIVYMNTELIEPALTELLQNTRKLEAALKEQN